MRILQQHLRVYVVAVPLNFAWEMMQGGLYEPMGTFWQATLRCFLASLVDGAVVLLIAMAGVVVFRSSDWFVRGRRDRYAFAAAAGLAAAIALERWGLASGRWAYNESMPVLPGTELGAVPLAQLLLLTPLTFYLSKVRVPRSF